MSVSQLPRDEDYDNLFGIFIGVENFPSSQGAIRGLAYPNQDAEEIYQLFRARGIARKMNYKLSLMVDQAYADSLQARSHQDTMNVKTATRANILRELTTNIAEAKANDLLLLYISTHGVIDYDDYFFIPTDGERDNILGTGIASSTLIRAAGKAAVRDVKVLIVIDTCHAGAMSFDLSQYSREFACLLSSSPIEYSYEFFDIKHGIFTNYLIKGLKGEAHKAGTVSLIGLYEYIYKQVQEKTRKRQNPLLIGTMAYATVLYATDESTIVEKVPSTR